VRPSSAAATSARSSGSDCPNATGSPCVSAPEDGRTPLNTYTGGEGVRRTGEGQEPWQDPQVWEMIASGGARAVHHIESPAMTSLCRMCNVREIDGLIAIVSVIRPGA